jgi:hypothetical protein
LRRDTYALTGSPDLTFARLALQMTQPKRALFLQLRGLGLQQGGLVVQELGRGARHFRIVLRVLLR